MLRRPPAVLLILLALLASPISAQDQDLIDEFADRLQQLERAPVPDGFGGGPMAQVSWLAFQNGDFIRSREAAERLLDEDPESIAGHCMMGMVQHQAEGNLPIALYLLRRCRKLFEERHGTDPTDEAPWYWHVMAITEAAYVNGEMGRHEDKIRLLLERDEIYLPSRPAERGWPLMRLRRYDAARAVVEEALASGDLMQVTAARTALCAIEAEEHKRQESYLACVAAAEHDREYNLRNPVPFTNAAEAALGVLAIDEAEEWAFEASKRFMSPTVSNPWLDLTHLYLAAGRVPEAHEAVEKMFRWRRKQPAYMDEQNRAEAEMASAVFLIVAGHPLEAARITARGMQRPDRTGFTSSESEQLESAVALVDRLANRTAAELLAEEASYSDFSTAWRARAASWQRRLRAWSSGRQVAALLVHERILDSTLRPYLAGSMELPEWIEPEIVGLIGPGVLDAALAEARERENLDGAEGYFLAYETEIAFHRGRWAETLRLMDEALATLPLREVLLQTRVMALGARAAQELGSTRRAVELYDRVMQNDPGMIRRLGFDLPAGFRVSSGAIAERAIRYLRSSPRFDNTGSGFTVQVSESDGGAEARLLGVNGTVLAQARVTPRAGDDTPADLARRLAREFHVQAFAPRLDLTQADIQSLDGSPTAGGGRASERLKSVLDMIEE